MLRPYSKNQRNALAYSQVSHDPAAVILTPQAQQTFQENKRITVSTPQYALRDFFARVYLAKVNNETVEIRVDRGSRYLKVGTRGHGTQVYPMPTAASMARMQRLIDAAKRGAMN